MLEKLSVIIPYWSDSPQRERILKWSLKFYEALLLEAELCIGELNCKKFSKSQAINLAAQKATRDIFLIADIDLIYDPEIIIKGIELLEKETWVLPFNRVINLSKNFTEKILASKPTGLGIRDYEGNERPSIGGGGLNLIPRKYFETVGGYDKRFIEWGAEDDAFTIAVTVLFGQPTRTSIIFPIKAQVDSSRSTQGSNVS